MDVKPPHNFRDSHRLPMAFHNILTEQHRLQRFVELSPHPILDWAKQRSLHIRFMAAASRYSVINRDAFMPTGTERIVSPLPSMRNCRTLSRRCRSWTLSLQSSSLLCTSLS